MQIRAPVLPRPHPLRTAEGRQVRHKRYEKDFYSLTEAVEERASCTGKRGAGRVAEASYSKHKDRGDRVVREGGVWAVNFILLQQSSAVRLRDSYTFPSSKV